MKMNNRRAEQLKERLKNELDLVEAYDSSRERNEQLVNAMARYLCVRISGFVEAAVRQILSDYATEVAKRAGNVADNERLKGYVITRLKTARNLTFGGVVDLLNAFDSKWGDEVTNRISVIQAHQKHQIKEEIEVIVSKRNEIAHGGWTNASIQDVREYYWIATELIEIVDDVCRAQMLLRKHCRERSHGNDA